ncbi:hypothetical protein MERGE_001624 [Pneumocystis wakefieldiae]|uniref:AP-1 complex subunit sigma-1 n=1 Tax=Pneumocystis wakefieldiae TaxID=38082 RepID=A0A899FVH6_9ASCO|nr:hypothetical protein MERGE_001624 [Pneumocystis wakefieldiae]
MKSLELRKTVTIIKHKKDLYDLFFRIRKISILKPFVYILADLSLAVYNGLVKWFITLNLKEKSRILKEVSQAVIQRRSKECNFLEYKDTKICYRRYASLFFIIGIEQTDNELITLEIIHRYVETLDKYFGNVCELDIIFNFQKAYFILDELIMAGEMQESSKKNVLKIISQQDIHEEQEQAEESFNILSRSKLTKFLMKINIKSWHAVASWHWNVPADDVCGICRVPFDGCCPDCKMPGDDCPIGKNIGKKRFLNILVWGKCNHTFHIHCIMKWLNTESSKGQCPMDRRKFEILFYLTIYDKIIYFITSETDSIHNIMWDASLNGPNMTFQYGNNGLIVFWKFSYDTETLNRLNTILHKRVAVCLLLFGDYDFSNILPPIKCSNCEEYVQLSKMGEHICEKTKEIYQENFKGYPYSSSFPEASKSPLESNKEVNGIGLYASSHNKSVSSSEVTYKDDEINMKNSREKRHIFERLNTVTPGPLGLRTHSNAKNTESIESERFSRDSSVQEAQDKSAKKRSAKLQPYRWPNSTSSQSSICMFDSSPSEKNYMDPMLQKKNKDYKEVNNEQMISPTCENIEKILTLKDKSNLTEYTRDRNSCSEKKSKTKNQTHSRQNSRKESRFPDENSERYLIEWARRDKELSSKFIEKTPNPVISIQECNNKNIHSKPFNEKKTLSNKHGHFFERNSNSTAFSTSSNISRDGKISSCSISSPNSEIFVSNFQEQKMIPKNELYTGSFDKTLNDVENSLHMFHARSDDILTFQINNTSQKNIVKNKYLSDFYCKRCNKYIEGKSIRCSDGKISGRFHRECFKCFNPNCQNLFTTSEVYVFEGEPFCSKHYHILNNSLCTACGEGIEGKCFQTEADDKYHFYCFTCYLCKKPLNGEYFDIDGKTYCENDVAKLLTLRMLPYQRLEKRKTKILTMGAF